jgi:hypothetical protein
VTLVFGLLNFTLRPESWQAAFCPQSETEAALRLPHFLPWASNAKVLRLSFRKHGLKAVRCHRISDTYKHKYSSHQGCDPRRCPPHSLFGYRNAVRRNRSRPTLQSLRYQAA